MNTATNRQIVQDGLNRRAAERRDAALEAQARKLRVIINDNHAAKTGSRPQERPQAEPKKEAGKQPRPRANQAERDAEAAYCTGFYGFLLRVFTPAIIAAIALGSTGAYGVPLQLTAPTAVVACLISLEAFATRFLLAERD